MGSIAISGRDGMKLLRQALGLPDWPCRYMKVEAHYNEAMTVELGGFARDGARVNQSWVSDDGEVARYEVTVRRMPDA